MLKEQIIQQGAEALLIKKDNILVKHRIKKSYRLCVLDDKLRRQRTKKESRLLEKASKLIPVPKIIKINEKNTEIDLQFIDGKKLSEYLDFLPNNIEICKLIGNNIAKLHNTNIIHGDLTTSNMLFSEKENKLYFIDFGLGFESSRDEDKAVDLHLIKEALESKHFQNASKFWHSILDGYKILENYAVVLKRLKSVEKRGRYKQSY